MQSPTEKKNIEARLNYSKTQVMLLVLAEVLLENLEKSTTLLSPLYQLCSFW